MTAPAILFRDDWLVAVDKPPGMLVHRSDIARAERRFALQLVRDSIGRQVWPVHRLDRGTSGVLLFALSAEIAAAVGRAFESDTVEKSYLALVRGWPDAHGVIDHPLARLREDGARDPDREPQPAATQYTRLARLEIDAPDGPHATSRYALLELRPRTGRRHQLRRHLKHAAHPIIGDATYGKGRHNRLLAAMLGTTRLWLHARVLALSHPVTAARIVIEAPPGPEWRRVRELPGWEADPAARNAIGAC